MALARSRSPKRSSSSSGNPARLDPAFHGYLAALAKDDDANLDASGVVRWKVVRILPPSMDQKDHQFCDAMVVEAVGRPGYVLKDKLKALHQVTVRFHGSMPKLTPDFFSNILDAKSNSCTKRVEDRFAELVAGWKAEDPASLRRILDGFFTSVADTFDKGCMFDPPPRWKHKKAFAEAAPPLADRPSPAAEAPAPADRCKEGLAARSTESAPPTNLDSPSFAERTGLAQGASASDAVSATTSKHFPAASDPAAKGPLKTEALPNDIGNDVADTQIDDDSDHQCPPQGSEPMDVEDSTEDEKDVRAVRIAEADTQPVEEVDASRSSAPSTGGRQQKLSEFSTLSDPILGVPVRSSASEARRGRPPKATPRPNLHGAAEQAEGEVCERLQAPDPAVTRSRGRGKPEAPAKERSSKKPSGRGRGQK